MDINSLKDIFECQRDLVELVQEKEWRLGYAPPHPREMDFLVRKHQDWFRTLAWYFVEEVAEYELSFDKHRPDELSDCLHFMVELCLFAGLDHTCLDHHMMVLSMEEAPPIPQLSWACIYLGSAVNMLKMKPWKESSQNSLDLPEFRRRMSLALMEVMMFISHQGLDALSIYLKKNKVNCDRSQNGY